MTSLSDSRPVGDLFSRPDTWADMPRWHAEIADLRRAQGAVLVEDDGYMPYLALLRHRDVGTVSRDNTAWLNTSRAVLGTDAEWEQTLSSGVPLPASLVQLDGERHRSHRAVTRDWFKPAVVGRRQPRIEQLAQEFVDRMKDLGGECDFAQDIAKPYTLRVIMDIYGVPVADEPLMMELTQGIFGAGDPEYVGDSDDAGMKALASMFRSIQYFNELTEARRACPMDDLASTIANAHIDGTAIGDTERLWYYIIIATAGHDTTSFALAGGLEALLGAPDQLRALREDRSLMINATEECVRWTSPVRHFLRYAAADTEIAGHPIAAGQRVLLSYPSANRDEEAFADSMSFDIKRIDAEKHFGFGGPGSHFCLGASFARRELRTFLTLMLDQIGDIELCGEPAWAESHFVSGTKHLPVRYRIR